MFSRLLLLCCVILLAGCRDTSLRDRFLQRERVVFLCQHHRFGTGIPQDLVENAGDVDALAPMWYDISDTGEVTPIHPGESTKAYRDFCRQRGIALLPIFRNFKPQKLLGNPLAVERAAAAIEAVVLSEGYDGATLDIEEDGIEGTTREPMLRLLRDLHSRLIARDRLFCATFSSIHWERGPNWQSSAMLAHCDWAFGMFYDYCGPWNHNRRPPTSTAPYDWPSAQWDIRRDVAKILRPPLTRKILLGIPAYGNDATFDAHGQSVSLVAHSVARLLEAKQRHNAPRQWDAQARTPFFEYHDAGLRHRVWYEDAESYGWRTRLAEETGCAGVGVWSIGAPGGSDPDFWPALRRYRSGE